MSGYFVFEVFFDGLKFFLYVVVQLDYVFLVFDGVFIGCGQGFDKVCGFFKFVNNGFGMFYDLFFVVEEGEVCFFVL